MGVLNLDSDEISRISQNGSHFVLSPENEKDLVKLLDTYEAIGKFIEQVKSNIEANALAIDKNFTGLRGDELKVEYRAFGAVYEMERPEKVPEEFIITKTTKSLDTKRVAMYEEEHGGELPMGVERRERKKIISIKRV